jgi:hypothetical protein
MGFSKKSLDDSLVKNFVINMMKDTFNINVHINPEHNKIDLLCDDDPDFGIEVEHGKWENNFWENDTYSLISKQGFRTINIPIRKHKYWLDEHKGKLNPRAEKNMFVRTNKNFTQFILIRPETVRDNKKLLITSFVPSNTNLLEDWMSFRREHVETYDLVDGKFVLKNVEK